MGVGDLERVVAQVAADEDWVIAAWIFGSRAEGTARRSSDLDVALLPARGVSPTPGCEDRVAAAIAERTGLDVDVVRLTDQSPVLGMEILGHGRRVYTCDEDSADAFEERLRRIYLDTAHLRRVQNHYLYGDPL